MIIGIGTFIAGKVLGPLFSKFADSPFIARTDFRDFRVVEDSKILSVSDISGEEIFQIDKEA